MAPRKCPKGFRWNEKQKTCLPIGGGGGNYDEALGEQAGGEGIFIGVPDDYRALGMGRWKRGKVMGRTNWGSHEVRRPVHSDAPIYKEGGQFRQLAGYSPDAIFELQVRLVNLGLLEEDGWVPGVNDPKTANAFKKVLAAANTQAREWQEVLPEMEENVEAAGGLGGPGDLPERDPLQISLTDPATLGSRGSDVAQMGGDVEGFGVIGRGMSDAEKMQFAQDYQNQQRMIQTDQYNRGLDPGEFVSGSESGPPSPEIAAEEWLKKHRPGEVIATNAAEKAKVFFDMLANSQWRLSKGS